MKTYRSGDQGDAFIVMTSGADELRASVLSAITAATGSIRFGVLRELCQVKAPALTEALAALVRQGKILKTKVGYVATRRQGGATPGKISPITDATRLPAGALLGLTMGADGSVESLEAWGQRELLEARGAALPVKGSDHPAFVRAGFRFGAALDSAFREAHIPVGWRLVAGECAVRTTFVDAKGRRRGEVIYRPAPRARARVAQMTLSPRYTVEVEYQGEFGKVGESHRAYVLDNATQVELFSTRTLRRKEKTDRKILRTEELQQEAAQWLAGRFPAHGDPAAYWD